MGGVGSECGHVRSSHRIRAIWFRQLDWLDGPSCCGGRCGRRVRSCSCGGHPRVARAVTTESQALCSRPGGLADRHGCASISGRPGRECGTLSRSTTRRFDIILNHADGPTLGLDNNASVQETCRHGYSADGTVGIAVGATGSRAGSRTCRAAGNPCRLVCGSCHGTPHQVWPLSFANHALMWWYQRRSEVIPA